MLDSFVLDVCIMYVEYVLIGCVWCAAIFEEALAACLECFLIFFIGIVCRSRA